MVIEARFGMKCWRLSGKQEASRIGIRRVGWKQWRFNQRSVEFFDSDSTGLATLESGHRIVIIGAAMIATMTPAMMARCNGLLAMGRSRANRVPSEGIVSSDKELSRHPRAYGITAKNKNTAKMTKSEAAAHKGRHQ